MPRALNRAGLISWLIHVDTWHCSGDEALARKALQSWNRAGTDAQAAIWRDWIFSVYGLCGPTEAADSKTIAGTVTVGASLTKTETGDTPTATATHPAAGSLTRTEAGDTIVAAGTLTWGARTGTAGLTEAADTLTAAGTVVSPPARTATLAQTEATDSKTATATAKVTGNLSKTQAGATVSAAGTVSWGTPAVLTLSRTQASETVLTAASVRVAAAVAKSEAVDSLAAAGTVPLLGRSGALSATQASQTAIGAATVTTHAGLAITEAADLARGAALPEEVGRAGDGWAPDWPPRRKPPPPAPPEKPKPPPRLRRPSRIAVLSLRAEDARITATATVETYALGAPKAAGARCESKGRVANEGFIRKRQEAQRARAWTRLRTKGYGRSRNSDARPCATGTVDWSGVIAEEDSLLTIEDWQAYALKNAGMGR